MVIQAQPMTRQEGGYDLIARLVSIGQHATTLCSNPGAHGYVLQSLGPQQIMALCTLTDAPSPGMGANMTEARVVLLREVHSKLATYMLKHLYEPLALPPPNDNDGNQPPTVSEYSRGWLRLRNVIVACSSLTSGSASGGGGRKDLVANLLKQVGCALCACERVDREGAERLA